MKRVTHNRTEWSNADEDIVEIEPYNPNWPDEFQRERNRLRAALPRDLACSIEHIGSTAVSGLAAKPILDIVIACGERSRWNEFREPIESLEYVFWAENPHPNRMFFVKGMPPFGQRRTHHIHVRLPDDTVLEIAFRDALRAHPALARDYEALNAILHCGFAMIATVIRNRRLSSSRKLWESRAKARQCRVACDPHSGASVPRPIP